MSRHLNYQEYKIDQQPWPAYLTEMVKARVKMAYDAENIFLEFVVREPFAQATYRANNGEVYKDSCVEFFVQFDDDKSYYNLECNILGNIRFFYGPDRNNRVAIVADIIEKIKRNLFFHPTYFEKQTYFEWRLSVTLPLSSFVHHQLAQMGNHRVRGNFYKCGDNYEQPHYLSWSFINTNHPDFHQPSYFGQLFSEDSQ